MGLSYKLPRFSSRTEGGELPTYTLDNLEVGEQLELKFDPINGVDKVHLHKVSNGSYHLLFKRSDGSWFTANVDDNFVSQSIKVGKTLIIPYTKTEKELNNPDYPESTGSKGSITIDIHSVEKIKPGALNNNDE